MDDTVSVPSKRPLYPHPHSFIVFRRHSFGPLRAETINNNDAAASTASTTLGLLSFDLDDTLFSVTETVHDANMRQIEHMNRLIDCSSFTEPDTTTTAFTLERFQETTRQIRRVLTEPVTYTTLRKLAIRREMEEHVAARELLFNPVDQEDACQNQILQNLSNDTSTMEAWVDEIFHVWLQERHDAAERHMFADTLTTLRAIRTRYPDACIAAITNGRGNPLCMPHTLAPYFDFCVSGEDDAVFPHRKPAPLIYHVALERYRTLYPHHRHPHDPSLQGSNNNSEGSATAGNTTSISSSFIWCHVGDCLANDVGGSAACGAYAVWYNPDSPKSDGDDDAVPIQEPSWSTATRTEVDQRQQLARQAKENSMIATRISSLSQLEQALEDFLQQQQSSL